MAIQGMAGHATKLSGTRYGYRPRTKVQVEREQAVVGDLPLFGGHLLFMDCNPTPADMIDRSLTDLIICAYLINMASEFTARLI